MGFPFELINKERRKMDLIFEKVKETKNTIKFEEKATEGNAPVIGALYVQKWWVGEVAEVKIKIEK